MRVVMIGTGYVGLVSGACFADFGHHVTCIDKDESKIDALNSGIMPIYEPGLESLVENNVKEDRLIFTISPDDAIAQADVVFIAVGTPERRGDGHADLSYVYAAAEEIAPLLKNYTVVVTKSTVPVGTGDEVEAIIARVNPDAKFDVASNPEFLREGAAITDFKRPDRIVVGAPTDQSIEVLKNLYHPLFINETPMVITERRTAELTKYAANAFLAVKISFINEIADLCDKVGANVQQVAHGIGLDNRIGTKFLHAGPGYGGSCFPKDTLALSKTAHDYEAPLAIVDTVIKVNHKRKKAMIDKVLSACGGDVNGKIIAILGLTFKPNTDDMREAPSLVIIPGLQALGATVRAYDPEGMDEARKMLENVQYETNPYDCIQDANAVVILTEWDQFRALDMDRVFSHLAEPNIVDLRNIYSVANMEKFNYHSIGRPNTTT